MSFTRLKPAEFLGAVVNKFNKDVLTQTELFSFRIDGISVPDWAQSTREADGMYHISNGKPVDNLEGEIKPFVPPVVPKEPLNNIATVTPITPVETLVSSNVPSKMKGFVKWGNYDDIKMLIESRRFFPLFITGLSGNGKTVNVKQACAETGRGFHRVNITIETSEDDLIGGFRLVDGNTVFEYGPVLKAMEAGDVLLLDEIDLGGPKLLVLQSILEGEGYYVKKLSKWVYPAEGFTVIATANTKGKGSSDGMFMYTNVMNEAMLERFKITIEQPYPELKDEKRILSGMLRSFTGSKLTIEETRTIDLLANWATSIRDSFKVGAIESVISTRRNVIIAETFNIYNDIEKSIKLAIARFDEETQEAMMTAYRMVDEKLAKKYAEVESLKMSDNVDINTSKFDDSFSEFDLMKKAAGLI